MYRRTLLVLIILVLSISLGYSQDLMLEPYGVSPAAIKADTVGDPSWLGSKIRDRVFTGLRNVGVETKVFLIGTSDDTSHSSFTWNLYEKPDGASAELSAPSTVDKTSEIVTFIADLAGTYRISISEGTAGDTIVINAATYKGVSGAAPNCENCHSGTFTTWQETGHATFLDRGLNGDNGSYYNESCISCHTIGFDTLANNDGFDDFDFVFPGTLQEGMADSMYDKYPEAMVRANIQCESCHGPGSAHNGDISDSKMVVSISADACASCHDDDHYHVYPSQWNTSGHGSGDHLYQVKEGSRDLMKINCEPLKPLFRMAM